MKKFGVSIMALKLCPPESNGSILGNIVGMSDRETPLLPFFPKLDV